jgi:hypothetical protein
MKAKYDMPTGKSKIWMVSLAAALIGLSTSTSLGAVLIDNTGDGANAISSSGTYMTTDNQWRAFIFDVASVYDLDVTAIKLGLRSGAAGDRLVHVALYDVASDLPTTQVGSYSFDITLSLTTSGAYYDLNSGNGFSGFTVTSGSTYALIIKGESDNASGVNWLRLSTDAAPVDTSYMTVDGYKYSSTSGSTWGAYATDTYNSVQMSGAAVPEPGEYALVFGLALVGFGFYRRFGSRKLSIQS